MYKRNPFLKAGYQISEFQVTDGGGGGITDNKLVKTNGTSGREYEVTGITVDDNDDVSGVRVLTFTGNIVLNDGIQRLILGYGNSSVNLNNKGNDLSIFNTQNFKFGFGSLEDTTGGGIGVFSELVAGTIPTVTPTQGGIRYWETDGMTVFTQNGNKAKIGDNLELPASASPKLGDRIQFNPVNGYIDFLVATGNFDLEVVIERTSFGSGSNMLQITSNNTEDSVSVAGGSKLYFNQNNNFGFNTTNYGSGDGVVALQEVTTPPNAPASGGIYYVENGALKYIGSGGTRTTIASA